MPRRFAVTGGIGAGKSTVINLLQQWGYSVIKADDLAHQTLHNAAVIREVTDLLGKEVLGTDGFLVREKIRALVFTRPNLRTCLEQIVHPRVGERYEQICQTLDSVSPTSWLFYEHPLVLQKGQQDQFEVILRVTAAAAIRTIRLQSSRELTSEEIASIIDVQEVSPLPHSENIIDIDNSGDEHSLARNLRTTLTVIAAKFSSSHI